MDQPSPPPPPFRFIRERVFGCATAQEFADLVGISPGHLSRLESGVGDPSFDLMERVRRLAAERGVDWSDSFFFQGAPVPARTPTPVSEAAS